jgi:hypothetical protein
MLGGESVPVRRAIQSEYDAHDAFIDERTPAA